MFPTHRVMCCPSSPSAAAVGSAPWIRTPSCSRSGFIFLGTRSTNLGERCDGPARPFWRARPLSRTSTIYINSPGGSFSDDRHLRHHAVRHCERGHRLHRAGRLGGGRPARGRHAGQAHDHPGRRILIHRRRWATWSRATSPTWRSRRRNCCAPASSWRRCSPAQPGQEWSGSVRHRAGQGLRRPKAHVAYGWWTRSPAAARPTPPLSACGDGWSRNCRRFPRSPAECVSWSTATWRSSI